MTKKTIKSTKKKTADDSGNSIALFQYWSKPEQIDLIACWSRDGYTCEDIAGKMGISPTTLKNYRKKNNEIENAIRKGKDVIDYAVESALLKLATGATSKEIKVIATFRDGKWQDIQKETLVKQHAPNVSACIHWLCNRQREKWQKNVDSSISVPEDQSFSITITRADKKIEEDGNESDC